MPKITFYLDQTVYEAMLKLSQKVARDPNAEAYVIVKNKLIDLGFINDEKIVDEYSNGVSSVGVTG